MGRARVDQFEAHPCFLQARGRGPKASTPRGCLQLADEVILVTVPEVECTNQVDDVVATERQHETATCRSRLHATELEKTKVLAGQVDQRASLDIGAAISMRGTGGSREELDGDVRRVVGDTTGVQAEREFVTSELPDRYDRVEAVLGEDACGIRPCLPVVSECLLPSQANLSGELCESKLLHG